MRWLRYFLGFLTVALFLSASVVKADGLVDPKIVLGGSGSCASFDQTSETQSFNHVPTDCLVDFTNDITSDDSGVTLHQLVVTVAGGPFELVCDGTTDPNSPLQGPAFQSSPNSCTFQETETFSEFDPITPGLTYSLTLGPEFGQFVDLTLSQQVITPEPATLLLVGTGLMALVGNKKRLKVAKPSL